MAKFNFRKISSWFKSATNKKKTAQKPVTIDSTVEAREATKEELSKLTPAQMHKKYFVQKNEAGLGFVVPLRGRGFVQKNERLMGKRKTLLGEFGISGRKAERILELFRLRKAASIVSNSRGFATEATVKVLLEFMRAQHKKYVEKKDESMIMVSEHAIKCMTSALENKDKERINKLMDNPFNEGLYDEVLLADFAINPHVEPLSRMTTGNYLGYMIAFESAEKELKALMGEAYDGFCAREKEERKRI